MEQKKADDYVSWLVEEQKKEKHEDLKKRLMLESQLYAKQNLEMEIEKLKGKLQVMEHVGDEDVAAVKNQIKEMNEELEQKVDEMRSSLEGFVQENRWRNKLNIEKLKAKLQVMKHLGDEDDAAVQNKIKDMIAELEQKVDEMGSSSSEPK